MAELDNTVDFTFDASAEFHGTTIAENNAHHEGGGAYFVTGQVEFHDSVVRGNSIESGNGGGLNVSAARMVFDRVEVTENDVAARGHGGGLYFDSNGELQIVDSQFVGNRLAADNTLLNSGGGQGGGLYLRSGTALVSRSLFESNVSVSDGGGIRNYTGQLMVLNSTISKNTILVNFNNLWGQGGGISSGKNLSHGSSQLTVVNSTVSENVAAVKGGGISLRHSAVIPNTVSENLEHTGVIHNSIVGGNFRTIGTTRYPDDVYGPTWDELSSYNVFGAIDVRSPLVVGKGTLAGTFSAPLDARLQPLAESGSHTRSYALLPTSPAVDLASDQIAAAYGLEIDQRGFSRFQDGNGDDVVSVDAGAHEWVYGDLDGSGALTASDIDLLSQHFGDERYDLNGDGVTNLGDLDTMVHDILHSEYGDANLDREVDGSDFLLWNEGKFLPGGWQQGDFNGDQAVDQSDFVLWMSNFGWSGVEAIAYPGDLFVHRVAEQQTTNGERWMPSERALFDLATAVVAARETPLVGRRTTTAQGWVGRAVQSSPHDVASDAYDPPWIGRDVDSVLRDLDDSRSDHAEQGVFR